jgi:hypothetical protein
MGQLIPLGAPGLKKNAGLDAETGPDRLREWTQSGQLTYGEAELLLVLDESTAWRSGN